MVYFYSSIAECSYGDRKINAGRRNIKTDIRHYTPLFSFSKGHLAFFFFFAVRSIVLVNWYKIVFPNYYEIFLSYCSRYIMHHSLVGTPKSGGLKT